MDDRRILTVSELNTAIRSLLEGRFPFVSVAGEISNLHRPHSGHLYFTLKDAGAQIKAVLFKMQQRYLAELPADRREAIEEIRAVILANLPAGRMPVPREQMLEVVAIMEAANRSRADGREVTL